MEIDAVQCRVPVLLERLVAWDFGTDIIRQALDAEKVDAIEAHQRAVLRRTGTFAFLGDKGSTGTRPSKGCTCSSRTTVFASPLSV